MQRRPVLALVFLLSVFCLSQNPVTSPGQSTQLPSAGLAVPYYQADFTPVIANGQHLVSWDKGHLVSFGFAEMKEPVTLYDRTGKWLFENPLTLENAVKVYGHDAAVTNSGTVVIAAAALKEDGTAADLIAEIGKDGIRRVIRTSPFRVLKLCTTQEGTIWAYGEELTDDRKSERRAQYPMLREYRLDKGQLRSDLDRITVVPPKGVPIAGARGEVQMRCGVDKVVIVSGVTNELIEYDLATSKLLRWPISLFPDGFYPNGTAITDSGNIYVSIFRPGQNAQSGIVELHVTSDGTAKWTPLTIGPFSAGKFFILIGNDGEDLVYSKGRSSPTLFWSKTAQTEMTK